ncbi:MAG: RNA methyltransferase [Euryarchaeota archaeon]|nr:RNA methyltransferase [Euryarchaeota archaeon]
MSSRKQPLLIIEHCEPTLSEWLMLEYKHAAKLWNGKLVFTRVADHKTAQVLRNLGSVRKENAKDLYSDKKCIVLDPQAKKPLTPKDCTSIDALIVGGLLGYEKPQGRTKTLISASSGFHTRHLGSLQLSIDGAVFVIKAICFGLKLNDIEIAKEIEIIHDTVHSTILPFGYPIIENTPVITPGLIEYLSKL